MYLLGHYGFQPSTEELKLLNKCISHYTSAEYKILNPTRGFIIFSEQSSSLFTNTTTLSHRWHFAQVIYPNGIIWKSLFDGTFLCEDDFCPLLHTVGAGGDNRKRACRAQRRVGPKARPMAGPPGPGPRVSAGFP